MSYETAFKNGLRPDPVLNLVEWADEYFFLPRESTAEYGKYRSDRTPMIKEVLLELSPSCPTEEVVVQKPTQLAGTTAALIFMLATADMQPGPTLLIQPTADLARSFSKKKLDPSVKATQAGSGRLKDKIKDAKSRDGDSTILEKVFPGGSWRLAGSNSPAVYRSESVRYIILDDFDGFDLSIGDEGDPGDLADRRTGTFKNRKIYKNSTPTLKDFSNIERAYLASSQGRFEVPCPHCGELQYLQFGDPKTPHGIKFARNLAGEITDCWYVCEHCHARIDEHHKAWMLPRGKYVHRYPDRPVRGFRYNALYTPLGWVNTWKYIAELFLAAKKSPEKLQVWTNTLMAETFERKGSQPDWSALSARCEPYDFLTIPAGGFLLSTGVDVQHDRLAVVIRAWGRQEASWLVYWAELYGDTSQPGGAWDQLDQLLNRQYSHSSGVKLQIVSVAIDSGDGARTQMVYGFVRARQPRCFAVKGMSQPGKPIIGRPTAQDVSFRGSTIKSGIMLWPVGADTAKGTIYSRLQLTDGPGTYHWPLGLDSEYFQQLTAEKQVTRYSKGFPVSEWVKTRPRNEALDCEIYAYAAAIRAGLGRMDFDAIEQQMLQQINQPTTPTAPTQNNWQKRTPVISRSKWLQR